MTSGPLLTHHETRGARSGSSARLRCWDDRDSVTTSPAQALSFGLLGPVVVWRNGRDVDVGSPQQRALLALLLLHRNEVVSLDRMVDALWPRRAPRNALQVVRTYISRLRACIEPHREPDARPRVLVTRHQGYELVIAADQADADRLQSLLTAARGRLEGSEPYQAELLLREALGLFRGTPLSELPDDPFAGYERDRIEELRLVAEEDLAEARLATGRERELVAELKAAVAREPLRERRWGELMVALYRSGRQAEALEAYREARRLLDERLGLDPGRDLRALERMILLQDESLDHPGRRRGGPPAYPTSFVGREADMQWLHAELRRSLLITLVGPAGVGKTRLAAAVAAALRPSLGDRLSWADLGSVAQGHAGAALARTLGTPDIPGHSPADLVVSRLRGTSGLFVLDGCEHVADEVSVLAGRLLEHAPKLRLLCTSREPLRLGGELVRPVAPLSVPPDASVDADRLTEYEAARLFLERSEAVGGRLTLDDATAAAVAEIVARLDGLPLAIELAVGKLRSLSPAELARKLDERFRLLRDGDRTGPARQRTLESAVGWSYDLLSSAEQSVLRKLAIFPHTFDAPAAESVAGDDDVTPGDVVAAVTRLVDASLLVAEPADPATRYRLLETVRAFALERTREAGEVEEAARTHRDFYLALAEDVARNMLGAELGPWLARARREHENLQAAVRWSLDHADGESALQLASALAYYWFRTSFLTEGRHLLARALDLAGPASRWRARGLVGQAWLGVAAGAAEAVELAREAVTACEVHPDRTLLALALAALANAQLTTGALAETRTVARRARKLFAEMGHEEGIALADQLLGLVLFRTGRPDAAADRLLRVRDRLRRLRGTLDAGWTLVQLADVMLARGRPREAIDPATDAVADFRHRGDPRGLAAGFIALGRAHAALGEEDRGRTLLEEALELSNRWGYAPEAAQAENALREVAAVSPG